MTVTSMHIPVDQEFAAALDAEVPQSRSIDNLTAVQVQLLFDRGLFWLQVPRCLGGGEADADVAFSSYESLARIDGSLAWTVMATAHTTAMMGAYLGDNAVADIFASPRALSAGQLAPRGTAIREGNSFRIRGEFGFASGSSHASWLMGGYREITQSGETVRDSTGRPTIIVAVVPRSAAVLSNDWNVLGLKATRSVDYVVPEQVVDVEYTWELGSGQPLRGGSMYGIGPFGLGCIAHSSFSVGVARRALDEIAHMARTKRRAGRPVLVEDPVFQTEYGKYEALLGSARAYAIETICALQDAATRDAVEPQHRGRARLATSHSARTGFEATEFAHRYAGSAGLRNGSTVQQCFRDISASEAHVFTDHNSWADAAAAILTGKSSPYQ